ncbi:transmembrane protein 11, mitochondrial-like [Antedon mediterranea]|uniref:transmembrane protein 11, mitochondrial-like n=1 Tax=Antedon mediterranea TaxID=105859 RepID=UPI003AF41975
MADDKQRELVGTDCAIIHEIYDNGNAQEQFEFELEQALEAQKAIIIIEPSRIGDETARWIVVGNCIHKMSVLSGVTALTSPLLLPESFSNFVCIPMGVISIGCAVLYGVSWQFDPCCKYQVEYNTRKLSKLPLHTLSTSSPVVLVRKDDKYRKLLHNMLSGMTCMYLGYKVYHWFLQ